MECPAIPTGRRHVMIETCDTCDEPQHECPYCPCLICLTCSEGYEIADDDKRPYHTECKAKADKHVEEPEPGY
jgi:hypothetical protein